MADYIEDVRKYDAGADEAVVGKIVKHLGIALRSRDASLVSCSDSSELDRVVEKWCGKKLQCGHVPRTVHHFICGLIPSRFAIVICFIHGCDASGVLKRIEKLQCGAANVFGKYNCRAQCRG